MSCNKTHKLITKTLGSQVTRTWIKLSDGLEETDAGVLTSLEASITAQDCDDCPAEKAQSIVQGVGTSIPAGLKTVTINNLGGNTTINGGFTLGNGRRVNSISFDATNHSCINGVLPAMTLAGGTWQWIGVQ